MAISTTTSSVDPWLQQFYQDNANNLSQQYDIAKNIYNSNATYQPYSGERIQGFTNDQLAGMQHVRDNQGIGQDALAGAVSRAGQAAKSWTDTGGQNFAPNSVQTQDYAGNLGYQAVDPAMVGTNIFDGAAAQHYMNPYTSNVLQNTLGEMGRMNSMGALADQGRAAKAGAFGGSRQAVVQSERDRNFGKAVSDTSMKAYDQAYQNAQGQFNTDQARALQGGMANQNSFNQVGLANEQNRQAVAGFNRDTFGQNQDRSLATQTQNQNMALQAYNANRDQFNTDQTRQLASGQLAGQLAPQMQQMAMQDANNLLTTGGMQQQLGQQNMGMAYQDFLNQRAQPYENFAFLQSASQGQNYNPYQSQQTQITSAPGPSGLAQAAGLASTALGVVGATGGFGSNGWLSNMWAGGS